MPRRPKVKEEVYTDRPLGVMVELKKTMLTIARLTRLSGDYAHDAVGTVGADGPLQNRHQQKLLLLDELGRLAKILPDHKVIGVTDIERARFIAALAKVKGFAFKQVQIIDATCDRMVAHTLKEVRRAEVSGIDS